MSNSQSRVMSMSLVEVAANRERLLTSYAEFTQNLNNFKSLVPHLVAQGFLKRNQAQEALNDTRHPDDFSKGLFVWDILLTKLTNENLRVLVTIFRDTGHVGLADLLLECGEEARQGWNQNARAGQVIKIRDIILMEPLTYGKWSIVVDHVVASPVDVHRIKVLMKDQDYGEAVLQTLHAWNGTDDAARPDLFKILTRLGLNSLANEPNKL